MTAALPQLWLLLEVSVSSRWGSSLRVRPAYMEGRRKLSNELFVAFEYMFRIMFNMRTSCSYRL